MTRSNLRSTLKRAPETNPMARYDRLPPELRRWLAQAALPWSPTASLRLWQRCLQKANGDRRAAEQRLYLAERKTLARDAPRVWGESYPL